MSAVEKSPFKGQVYAYGEYHQSSLVKDFGKDGSFELNCSVDNTDIPHNRISLQLLKSFSLLLESVEKADVTFQVKNRSFMCNRLILVARSPVFNAELFGNMAEAKQKLINIEDMSPEVFEALLHFIYTDYFPCCDSDKSSIKMAQHLFVAADRDAIEGLKALCEDKLCAHISLDTVTTTLALAQQHNSPRLKNACLYFIVEQGALTSLILSDEYEDFVRSYSSIVADRFPRSPTSALQIQMNHITQRGKL